MDESEKLKLSKQKEQEEEAEIRQIVIQLLHSMGIPTYERLDEDWVKTIQGQG